MVYAFILHTLSTGPCRVLFSSVFVHETQDSEGEVVGDARERRKEQLLNVASRVQSEFSFRFVASGNIQPVDTTGLATTDELLSQLETGIFRISAGNPFESEKIVVWKGLANCGFTLICEKTENRALAENVLSLIIRYLQDYCRVIFQPAEAILKADKMTAILFQFLPNGQVTTKLQLVNLSRKLHHSRSINEKYCPYLSGLIPQLLFMNHRFVRQLEKELEQIMAMK